MFRNLDDIISQDRAVSILRSAFEADRLPHGMIFAGPSGVGKRTTAEALAAVFLCEKPAHLKACGKCESCRLMAAGNHPDFHLIYRQLIRLEKSENKARELSVHVIRQYLIDPANLRPSMNRGKVFVVEEAELMNASAQNTLLKTLEEPAGRTLIILLTDQPGILLPTIRSRTQVIPFGPIETKLLISELKRRGIKDPESAAFFAEGSLGLAIQWSEDGVIDDAIALQKSLEQLSAGRPADLDVWIKKSADAYAARQLQRDSLSSKDQATHDGLAIYLRIASHILRQMCRNESDFDRIEQICQAIEDIAQGELNLQSNVNVALALMQWSMSMEKELSAGG